MKNAAFSSSLASWPMRTRLFPSSVKEEGKKGGVRFHAYRTGRSLLLLLLFPLCVQTQREGGKVRGESQSRGRMAGKKTVRRRFSFPHLSKAFVLFFSQSPEKKAGENFCRFFLFFFSDIDLFWEIGRVSLFLRRRRGFLKSNCRREPGLRIERTVLHHTADLYPHPPPPALGGERSSIESVREVYSFFSGTT